jgi:hypothetical protein
MRSRYQSGARRAAGLAALGVSGALAAQSLGLNPGSYELVATTQLTPQASAAMSPDAVARLRQPRMLSVCIGDSSQPQSRDADLAQAEELVGHSSDPSCRLTGHSSSGNHLKFVLQCAHDSIGFDGLFAANSYRATMIMKSDQGQTTTVNLNAQRIGNCSR